MQLVKVGDQFYQECKKQGTDQEMLFNKSGRPCVLIMKLKYKGKNRQFVVPLRSNIPSNVPKEQYFSLPLILPPKQETGMGYIIQNYFQQIVNR